MNNKRFSNASKTYDLHAAPQKQLARTIVDFLPILENPSILEIGSGTGVLTRKLQEKFPNSKIHAIDIADKLSLDPKVMAIALIFAVNTSFLTPLAYQTNLLVMGPGHYKFIDYIKLGLPLSFICWIVFYLSFPILFKI